MPDETLSKGIMKMTDRELDGTIKRYKKITRIYKPDPFVQELLEKLLTEKSIRKRMR